ncbi:Uncharacterized protein HZ326_23343 [Fusarium oxysporum f. sp. albedinis]|nr:Uncharacterized protein HZ326_23343 [Fusarium oxysporum f. sp. albedinis]
MLHHMAFNKTRRSFLVFSNYRNFMQAHGIESAPSANSKCIMQNRIWWLISDRRVGGMVSLGTTPPLVFADAID